jgi:hypothetical protein
MARKEEKESVAKDAKPASRVIGWVYEGIVEAKEESSDRMGKSEQHLLGNES